VRVRVVLGVALLAVAGAFVLDMSGRAPRTAGSDHISPAVFSATMVGRGVLCQPGVSLPEDAARVQLLVGTYGRPAPDLRIDFLGTAGTVVATGHLPAGAPEGYVTIPLARSAGAAPASRVCLHVGHSAKTVLGGEGGAFGANSEVVDGAAQPGRITLLYLRKGSESWWQLLPELARRFGLGKASFFGAWTLPVVALLLLGVWAGAVRLLLRELT
jgi:hypothetical protein